MTHRGPCQPRPCCDSVRRRAPLGETRGRRAGGSPDSPGFLRGSLGEDEEGRRALRRNTLRSPGVGPARSGRGRRPRVSAPAPRVPGQEHGADWVEEENFYNEGGEALAQAARRGGRCPIPGTSQARLDGALSTLTQLEMSLLTAGGGLGGLGRSLPTQTILWSHDGWRWVFNAWRTWAQQKRHKGRGCDHVWWRSTEFLGRCSSVPVPGSLFHPSAA